MEIHLYFTGPVPALTVRTAKLCTPPFLSAAQRMPCRHCPKGLPHVRFSHTTLLLVVLNVLQLALAKPTRVWKLKQVSGKNALRPATTERSGSKNVMRAAQT